MTRASDPNGSRMLRRNQQHRSLNEPKAHADEKNLMDLLDFNLNNDKSEEDLFNDLIRRLEYEQERRSNLTQHSKDLLIDELNKLNVKLKEKLSKEMGGERIDGLLNDVKSTSPFDFRTSLSNQLMQADLPAGLSLLDKVKKINNLTTPPLEETSSSSTSSSTTTTTTSTTTTSTTSTKSAPTSSTIPLTYNPKPTTTRIKLGPNDYTRRPSTTIVQTTMAPRRTQPTKTTRRSTESSSSSASNKSSMNLSSIRNISTLVPSIASLSNLAHNKTKLVTTLLPSKPSLVRILNESNRKLNETATTTTRSSRLIFTTMTETPLLSESNKMTTTGSIISYLSEDVIKPVLLPKSGVNSTLAGHQHFDPSGGAFLSPTLCSCNNTSIFSSPSFRQPNNILEHYPGIWKFSFFILAFLIGFISLLLVLTFAAKAVMLNIQKKNLFGFRTYRLKNLASIKNDKITSASLFDYDAEVNSASNLALTLPKSARLDNSAQSNRTNGEKKPTGAKVNGFTTLVGKEVKECGGIGFALITPTGSMVPRGGVANEKNYQIQQQQQLTNQLNELNNTLIKTTETMKNCLSNTTNQIAVKKPALAIPPQTNKECYIYGISNGAFVGDLLFDDKQHQQMVESNINSIQLSNTNYVNDHKNLKNYVSPFDERYLCTFSKLNGSEATESKSIQPEVSASSFRPKPHAPPLPQMDHANENHPRLLNDAALRNLQNKLNSQNHQMSRSTNAINEKFEDLTSNNKSAPVKTNSVNKVYNYPTYQAPWQLTSGPAHLPHPQQPQQQHSNQQTQTNQHLSNDYEALETNTITGSFANLSMVTSFSEVIEDGNHQNNQNINKNGNATHAHAHVHVDNGHAVYHPNTKTLEHKVISMNNNEIISRSSKITQELEIKLKERRMIMESKSDKFKPKIIHQNDLNNLMNVNPIESASSSLESGASSDDLEKQMNYWHQSELVATSSSSTGTNNNDHFNAKNLPLIGYQPITSSSSNHSCVCPCHQHGKKRTDDDEHHHHLHHHHHHHPTSSELFMSEADFEQQAEYFESEAIEQAQQHHCHHQHHPHGQYQHRHHSSDPRYGQMTSPTTSSSDSTSRSKSSSSSSASNLSITTSSPVKPATLPKKTGVAAKATKRESIRMLIENKAVSENKQKDALELHLSTILCTRSSLYN